jgi:hypothetical protein
MAAKDEKEVPCKYNQPKDSVPSPVEGCAVFTSDSDCKKASSSITSDSTGMQVTGTIQLKGGQAHIVIPLPVQVCLLCMDDILVLVLFLHADRVA